MNKMNIREVLEVGAAPKGLPENQFPNIGLYMDQVITLIADSMGGDRVQDLEGEEKPLTKTMINNYSKDGVLGRIKGKKYSRQHILMMSVIYHLKQTLSIQDIKRLTDSLTPDIWDEGANAYDPDKISWMYACCNKANDLAAGQLPPLAQALVDEMSPCPDWDVSDPIAGLMVLTALSALCRRGAQALLEAHFLPAAKSKKSPQKKKVPSALKAEDEQTV